MKPPGPRQVEVYEVGGAVRDALLGRPVADRDWLVVGATPEMMLASGYTPVGLQRDRRMVDSLRARGIIRRPADLGIDVRDATRNQLAARSMRDLVRASGGLYQPPKKFRNW